MSKHANFDESTLEDTIETMRWLHATAQAQPDPSFVDHLEHTLMSETLRPAGSIDPVPSPVEILPASTGRAPAPPFPPSRSGWAYRFSAFAIVMALISGSILAISRLEGEKNPSPTYTGMGAGDFETATSASGDISTEWRVTTPATAMITADDIGRTGGLEVIGDLLIRAWSNRDASGLEAVSTTTGEVVWSIDTAWKTASSNFPHAVANYAFQHDDQNIYVLNQIQPADETISEAPPLALTAIAIASGEEVWTREFDGGVATIGTGPAGLFVQSYGEGLQKIDPTTGDAIWTYVGEAEISQGIAPFSGNEALIVVNGNGVVSSVDPETGELGWQIETGHPSYYFSIAESALETGDTVIVVRSVNQLPEESEGERFSETKSELRTVDLETGEILWTQTLNDPSKGEMQLADGMIYATTSLVRYPITNDAGEQIDTGFRNWLVAIDLETGAEVWSIKSDPAWGMAFELRGDTLIMYRSYGAFVAVDLESGTIICDAFTPSGAASDDDDRSPDAAVYDGEMLYLSLGNGELMTVDPGNWSC